MGTDFEPVCYNFIKIDDLDAPELRPYNIRSEVQLLRANEPDPGVFICESSKVILRALDAGYEPISVLTAQGDPDEETKKLYERCAGVPIYLGSDEALREIAGYALTGGVFALMKRKKLKSISELLGDGRVSEGKAVKMFRTLQTLARYSVRLRPWGWMPLSLLQIHPIRYIGEQKESAWGRCSRFHGLWWIKIRTI